ncbi:MAG: helix-turn-helix domain-containing protein, partial [Cyclobacteriaceae bacterium]
MLRAYKYRIYPNAQQQEVLAKTFGCVRLIYNSGL